MTVRTPAPPAEVNRHAARVSPTAGLADFQAAGEIRILILDDDPSVCTFIRALLGNDGFMIDTLSDPSQVEGWLKGQRYHLIILDYVLPGLDAEQVFAWVRDHQPDASIIVVTGYPSVDSALNCLRARTYDYLTKPFQVEPAAEDRGPLPGAEGPAADDRGGPAGVARRRRSASAARAWG